MADSDVISHVGKPAVVPNVNCVGKKRTASDERLRASDAMMRKTVVVSNYSMNRTQLPILGEAFAAH